MTGILNLPGLNELGMKELDAEYHVKAEPAAISRLCPHCGELHRVQKHGSRSMFIRDLPTHGKTMMIHLDVPRLICLACRKTFMAVVAEVDADHSMTERLVRWMGRQSIEYTYAEVAKQVGVDEKTVRNIFDAYVANLEKQFQRETPIWLRIPMKGATDSNPKPATFSGRKPTTHPHGYRQGRKHPAKSSVN